MAPPGECLSSTEMFRRLARRLGLATPCLYDSDDEMARQVLDSGHPSLHGITLERLIAGADHYLLNSLFANLAHQRPRSGPLVIRIHPDDAAARGLETGHEARVFNDRGAFVACVEFTVFHDNRVEVERLQAATAAPRPLGSPRPTPPTAPAAG